jgi:hypothetical protein
MALEIGGAAPKCLSVRGHTDLTVYWTRQTIGYEQRLRKIFSGRRLTVPLYSTQ